MRDDYYKSWMKRTLEEVQIEIDNERQVLQEILDDEPYEDRGRQIEATRDNIAMLQRIVGEKSRQCDDSGSNVETKLAKLQDLLRKGLISVDEYNTTRAAILRNI